MRVLKQEHYLLHVDTVPRDIHHGHILRSEEGRFCKVVYIDRDNLEIGVWPISVPKAGQ
jgi:hypothetical protein